jgi:hypothetical protein
LTRWRWAQPIQSILTLSGNDFIDPHRASLKDEWEVERKIVAAVEDDVIDPATESHLDDPL